MHIHVDQIDLVVEMASRAASWVNHKSKYNKSQSAGYNIFNVSKILGREEIREERE
jgi:hypothetical protein